MCIRDSCKEVVNVKTGTKIGMVCDVAVDTCNATVLSIIVYGLSLIHIYKQLLPALQR